MTYDWGKIGGRIKTERKARGMSMDDLAAELGTTRQSISKWEKGEGVEITLNMLLSLCNVFDCELGYLLGEFDCKTRAETDVCEKTGLSPKAVKNLLTLRRLSIPKREIEPKNINGKLEYRKLEFSYVKTPNIFAGDIVPEGDTMNHEYDVLGFIDDLLRNATLERRRAWVALMTFAQKYQEYKQSRLTRELWNTTFTTFRKVDARMEQKAFFLQKYMLDFIEEIGDMYVSVDSKGTGEREEMEKIMNELEKLEKGRRAKEDIDG